MNIGYVANAWGPVLGHWAAPNNVNAAYYRCPCDLENVFADISGAGYEAVEIFDGDLLEFQGNEDAFQTLLDRYQLRLKGVYVACNFIYDEILPEELDRLRRAAILAKRFGATEIALGGGAVRYDGIRESDYVKLGEALDKVCNLADEIQMRASFHPHMGSLVETPQQLAKVMAHTKICLCPDTGHVRAGGGDPLTVIQTYKDRIHYIHLKDITVDGMFCPLGVGVIDFQPILDEISNSAHAIDVTIECDGWAGNPAEGAKITADFLKKNFKKV